MCKMNRKLLLIVISKSYRLFNKIKKPMSMSYVPLTLGNRIDHVGTLFLFDSWT